MEKRLRNRITPRKQGNKPPRKTIFIVCEGQKTEPNYFQHLKQKWQDEYQNVGKMVNIDIRDPRDIKGNTPEKIIEYAVNLKKEMTRATMERGGDFDIWCVFDVEAIGTYPNLVNTLARARIKNINVAISNPAFEYWILLHFTMSTTSYDNCEKVTSILRKTHWPTYHKGIKDFSILDKRMNSAKTRAKTVRKNSPPPYGIDPVPRPSTNVDELLEYVENMLKPPYS